MLQRHGRPPVMPGRLSERALDALGREWQLAQSHASGIEDRVAQGGPMAAAAYRDGTVKLSQVPSATK